MSSGFRAPNIDDAARIFESSSALQRVIIPNAAIRPEYTYNFDLGLTYNVKNKIRFELTGFYTLFRNAIALAPIPLNGQDSLLYNGVMSAVYTNQNVNRAFLRGLNARLKIELCKSLSWDNTISQTYGRYVNPDKSKKPMDHIPRYLANPPLLIPLKIQYRIFYAIQWLEKKSKTIIRMGKTTDNMPRWTVCLPG